MGLQPGIREPTQLPWQAEGNTKLPKVGILGILPRDAERASDGISFEHILNTIRGFLSL